ncbi:MAG: hypothetical protein NC548_27755 [Lachnospiraceae bacterium]|nr:hypothetical protein [Lachnospiraceae bacterium]
MLKFKPVFDVRNEKTDMKAFVCAKRNVTVYNIERSKDNLTGTWTLEGEDEWPIFCIKIERPYADWQDGVMTIERVDAPSLPLTANTREDGFRKIAYYLRELQQLGYIIMDDWGRLNISEFLMAGCNCDTEYLHLDESREVYSRRMEYGIREQIAGIIKEEGHSIQTLAQLIQVSDQTIRNALNPRNYVSSGPSNGNRIRVTLKTVCCIADALGYEVRLIKKNYAE